MSFGLFRVTQNISAEMLNSTRRNWTLPFTKSRYLGMRSGSVTRQVKSDAPTQECVPLSACTFGNVAVGSKKRKCCTDVIRRLHPSDVVWAVAKATSSAAGPSCRQFESFPAPRYPQFPDSSG